uniref:PX domain-containing protein n=1 Tax=Setaria digitata TaxID=48799 RepID=A0A915Q2X1_9BILA
MESSAAAVVDITHPLKCTLIDWIRLSDHVEYMVEVKSQLGIRTSWHIRRRYAQFRKLNSEIEKFGVDLDFPPRKFIGNAKESFIKQRMLALQEFLDAVCLQPALYACPAVANFLESFTETYVGLNEWILLTFRDKREWIIEQQRKHCGWRSGKVHYEVRYGPSKLILSGVRYGPDRFGTVASLNSVLDFLRTLQSPHLNESVTSWATDGGILYIRPIFKGGTLRDRLYKSNWKDDFFTKYRTDSAICSLETYDVRLVCRQLLEILTLLNAISVPYRAFHFTSFDIHAGNIVVTECGCELIDLDQVLTGQPNFRRPSMLCCHAINTLEDMFVFTFGQLLFELLTGFLTFPVHSATEALTIVPSIFQPILNSIFSPEVRSLPRLQDLINSNLFVDIPVAKMKQREIRIPRDIKEVLDGLCNNILGRYKRDRTQFNNIKKQRKFQQLLNSEAEKLRRKEIIKVCPQAKLS